MNIVADRNMPLLDETFARHGTVQRLDGRAIGPADVAGADVLLVRSVTPVGPALLEGSRVRWVGSATIGTDHLDTGWLDAAGIGWANAPGCNADAAAQYTLGMMLLACRRLGREWRTQSVGIIGRGNVGTRLAALLEVLAIDWVACDPPLAEQGVSGLVGLRDALACPVVSLHVPLTHSGRYATENLLDAATLAALPADALLVNTSRGRVVADLPLREALDAGRIHAALDVWPGEPDIRPDLLKRVSVATPHVAGYSREGRENGTRMVYAAFRRWRGLQEDPAATSSAGTTAVSDPARRKRQLESLVDRVLRDDHALRAAAGRAGGFDALRRDYPLREEFNWNP